MRLLLAATLFYFLTKILVEVFSQPQGFLASQRGWSVPGGTWWVGAIACFLALSVVVNSGFSRHWGAWPQAAFLFLAAGAIVWDRQAYGSLWAMPLAFLVLLLITYVLAHAGISFLVAAFAATPG